MDYVKREDLTGFREPTESEKQSVAAHAGRTHAKDIKPMTFWNLFFTLVTIMFLFNIILAFRNGETGRCVFHGLFFLIFGSSAVATWRSKRQHKELLRKLRIGEFQVLDCRGYESSYNQQLMSTAGIKIMDAGNHKCDAVFIVDKSVARAYDKNKNTKLLLVRCGDEFYDVITAPGRWQV